MEGSTERTARLPQLAKTHAFGLVPQAIESRIGGETSKKGKRGNSARGALSGGSMGGYGTGEGEKTRASTSRQEGGLTLDP